MRRARPDATNAFGHTALMFACDKLDVELVSMLLAAGADPSVRVTGGPGDWIRDWKGLDARAIAERSEATGARDEVRALLAAQ